MQVICFIWLLKSKTTRPVSSILPLILIKEFSLIYMQRQSGSYQIQELTYNGIGDKIFSQDQHDL